MSFVRAAIPLFMPMDRNQRRMELILPDRLGVSDAKCSADARLSCRIANLGLYLHHGV